MRIQSGSLWAAAVLAVLQAITIQYNRATADYPESILFELAASSSAEIESVVLEFGTDALSCGQTLTRAVPEDFTTGRSIEAEWNWDLRVTGSLPPGTTVWWRWELRDRSGATLETPIQELTFNDEQLHWRGLETDRLAIYWLEGDMDFGKALLDAGQAALTTLERDTGVDLDQRVEAFVYRSSAEMQAATLFSPEWSGALAFPSYGRVVLGISQADLDWGLNAIAHELSHVVIGRYVFSCVNSMPIWVDEGLALHAEPEIEPTYDNLLKEAIREDNLHSVRELGELFSVDPERARLAYAQSHSLIEYLIEQHGSDAILRLLDEFRAGSSEDRALMTVYGLNREGLDAEWRAWIGATPSLVGGHTAAEATHTPYPTLAPIVGPATPASSTSSTASPSAATPTSASEPGAEAAADQEAGPRSSVPLIAIGTGVAIVGGVTWFLRRRGLRD